MSELYEDPMYLPFMYKPDCVLHKDAMSYDPKHDTNKLAPILGESSTSRRTVPEGNIHSHENQTDPPYKVKESINVGHRNCETSLVLCIVCVILWSYRWS